MSKYLIRKNRRLSLFWFILMFLGFCQAAYADSFTLFDKGRTEYTIIISDYASNSELFSAYEIQKYINEISGAKMQVKSESFGKKGKRIIIGYNHSVLDLEPNLQKPLNSEQSFCYFSVAGDIVIVGGNEIGTLYGAYSFLEKELGCRWLTNQVSFIPKLSSWHFTSLYETSSPAFDYRYIYSKGSFDKLWSLKNKNNGIPENYQTEYGIIKDCQIPFWGVHTFNRFVPPTKYFDIHPEYYSLINGKREPKQLCLSNKNVKKLCTNALRDIIKSNSGYMVYDLSQNDNITPCQCRKCKKLKKKYGSESGVVIWFVNSVAKELKKDFPDKFIGTLAYQYSQNPPKSIKPEQNVAIRLSLINTCLIHDLENCPKNKNAGADVKGWCSLTKNLYIWDYMSSSRLYYTPIPNFEAIRKRIIFYKENGARGVMFEGNSETEYGEFSSLRNYVIAKLLWNPYINLDSLVTDFIHHYYSSVSQEIKAYYDLTQQRALDTTNHLHFVMDHKNEVYSEEYLGKAYTLLTTAEQKATDTVIKERVQVELMSVAYMLCKVNPQRGKGIGAYEFVKKWTSSKGIERFAGFGENTDKNVFIEQMNKTK